MNTAIARADIQRSPIPSKQSAPGRAPVVQHRVDHVNQVDKGYDFQTDPDAMAFAALVAEALLTACATATTSTDPAPATAAASGRGGLRVHNP